jgi:hypothetical protein
MCKELKYDEKDILLVSIMYTKAYNTVKEDVTHGKKNIVGN